MKVINRVNDGSKVMKSLKKILLLIFILSLVSLGLGCGKKDKRSPIRSGRDARSPSSPATADTRTFTSSDGVVFGSPDSEFQEVIYYLVSASINPNTFGTISGQPGQNTGVKFSGNIQLNSIFNPSSASSNIQVRSEGSHVRILIRDSFVGQQDSNGNAIPEYTIDNSSNISGYIQGNHAVIKLVDEFGSITFDGNVSADVYQGSFSFDNNMYWNGQTPGARGTVGSFRISTCGFFKCN